MPPVPSRPLTAPSERGTSTDGNHANAFSEQPSGSRHSVAVQPNQAAPIGALENALTRLIRRAFLPTAGAAARREAGVHLERATYATLIRIIELDGPRLSDLAHIMGLDISTASRHVKRLVGEGYVSVEVCTDDGRARRYTATSAGLDAVSRVRTARHRHLEELLAAWEPGDVQQLADGIDRLLATLADAERFTQQ